MSHRSLARSAIAVLAALLLLSGMPAAAQDTGTASHPIVGTWRVFLGEDTHVHGLLTHHADGTLTASDPVTMAAEPGMVGYQSAAFGVWEATGPATVAYTYQQFVSDPDGNVVGIATVSGTREVSADGQAFAGAGLFELADLDGNVLLSAPSPDVRGERLAVVPGAAAATPAA